MTVEKGGITVLLGMMTLCHNKFCVGQRQNKSNETKSKKALLLYTNGIPSECLYVGLDVCSLATATVLKI